MIRLPFIATVSRGYAFAFRHIVLLARIGWPWFVAAHLAAFAAPVLAARAGAVPVALAGELFVVVAGTAVVVAWHRAIAARADARRIARFGRRELRYLGLGLGLLVVLYIPVVAMASITFAAGGRPAPALIWPLAAVFLVLAVSINRLILVFPGIALERREMTLSRSWALTRGNTCRLFFGILLCSGPLLVLAAGLDATAEILMARGAAGWLGHVLALAGSLVLFLQLAVVGSYLSFVFEHFAAQPLPASRSRAGAAGAVTA